MFKKAYNKSIVREILSSKARFISIMAIIFLGVAFYSGINSTGPDMEAAINNYYKSYNLMDGKIVSDLGINDDDLKLLENNDKILDYYATHSLDVNLTNMNSVVKFMEYDSKKTIINDFVIADGRLPKNPGEIALDEKVLNTKGDLKIGDDYIIESDESTMDFFKKKTYKIVGFVKSPLFIDKNSRGNTNIGTGSVDYFAVINSADFSMDIYTEVFVRFKNVENLGAYSDEYKDKIYENDKYLKELFAARSKDRVAAIKLESKDKVDAAYKEIEDGEKKLLDAEKEIEKGSSELQDGREKYKQAQIDYDKRIKDGQAQLEKSEVEINQGQTELDTQKLQFENGQKQIDETKAELDKLRDHFLSQGINPETDIVEYQNALATYEKEVGAFNEGREKLKEAQNKLDAARIDLEKGKREIQTGKTQGKVELDKAKIKLEDAEREIKDGQEEIKENKQKLSEARLKLVDEEAKLKELDNSKYYFFDRGDNPGYSTYGDSIQSLDNIASVFPVFFFLVAVLICLTTMERMVEENRSEIGTLKALGYSGLEISKKFVIYAALASIFGSVIGILAGSSALPIIINNSYASMFNIPSIEIHYYTSYVVQSIVISILCTVGTSLFVVMAELKENPSNLMRVKAPKLGKKILLERITPLWKRFNFNQKVTFRNLFRYKQRMIMTILGIAGCTAMLVTGFSLNKSNEVVIDKQFNKLIKYDAIVAFNENSNEDSKEKYNEILTGLDDYKSSLEVHQETVTFSKEGINKQSVSMYVPKITKDINDFVSLSNRKTDSDYKLSDSGVIISEKLAKILKVSAGDTASLKDSNEDSYKVKIEYVAENYNGHFIYMSPEYYKKVFNKDATYNMQFVNLKSNQNEEKIQTTLMDTDRALNVTLMSKLESSSKDLNLNAVMLVIIGASGCLAFVVLYNLININVSERIRELSTIKVLGFYDNEVTMYIFRENIILTVLGIVAGSFMGKVLYNFILNTAETDEMMMIPDVYMSSYLMSGLITLLFAFLVMIMMHIKLRNINMIDALKSVE